MQVKDSFQASLQNISSHFLRSLLTLLGIIIGVFAVVTMFSSIYGIKQLIKDNMEGMGWNNSVIIYPSTGNEDGGHFRSRRMRFRYIRREAKPLTLTDYLMLQKEINTKYIYGMVESYEKFYHAQKDFNVQLRATNQDFFLTQTYPLAKGRYFNDYEINNAAKVCVVGYHFANEHFADQDPLHRNIKIGNNVYRIIGVLDLDILNKGGMNFNPWQRREDLKAVYIPLSTGAKYLRNYDAIDYIYLQSRDDFSFRKMKNDTYQKLLAKHSMTHDFAFNDVGALMLKITEEINDRMEKWNITLSAIASISLIVGGIGLFSTLLISINERMMEIGVRKSIGATDFDIFLHFIMEAVILALIGAAIGIMISSLLVKVIAVALKTNFPIPLPGILLGISFSLLIGIISGFYPAWKASKIDPIKAIYYFE
ncbi:MAG: ABC transporter permease [Candidatus Cloacimonetes bacterium]|nr:ABC transporter permease [Candidatus Cloacimonadota bacterium]